MNIPVLHAKKTWKTIEMIESWRLGIDDESKHVNMCNRLNNRRIYLCSVAAKDIDGHCNSLVDIFSRSKVIVPVYERSIAPTLRRWGQRRSFDNQTRTWKLVRLNPTGPTAPNSPRLMWSREIKRLIRVTEFIC